MTEGRWSIERGDKVRVLDGPYRGCEGVVAEAAGGTPLRVLVSVLGRHIRLDLTPGQVRPL